MDNKLNTFYLEARLITENIFKHQLKDKFPNILISSNLYQIKNFHCHVNFIKNNDHNINNRTEKIVFIHGYGACSTDYLKMVSYFINENFEIIMPDLIAMGLSCLEVEENNNNLFNTNEECLHYYLEYLDILFKQLDIKQFYMIAHSMGGYIASHYMAKYKNKNCLKLFLISPGGFNRADENNEFEIIKERFDKILPFYLKFITKFTYRKIFDSKKSPYDLLVWPFRRIFLSKLYSKESFKLDDYESNQLLNLFDLIYKEKPKGYKCIGYFFHYGMRSLNPIIDIFEEIPVKCYFYFGAHDWMDKQDVLESLKQFSNTKYEYYLINNSNHEIMFDNEVDLSNKILESILNNN